MKPQLFTRAEAPRRPPRKLMHVVDAGDGCINLECKHCGHNTGWIKETETTTRYRRGLPCPECSPISNIGETRNG